MVAILLEHLAQREFSSRALARDLVWIGARLHNLQCHLGSPRARQAAAPSLRRRSPRRFPPTHEPLPVHLAADDEGLLRLGDPHTKARRRLLTRVVEDVVHPLRIRLENERSTLVQANWLAVDREPLDQRHGQFNFHFATHLEMGSVPCRCGGLP